MVKGFVKIRINLVKYEWKKYDATIFCGYAIPGIFSEKKMAEMNVVLTANIMKE